MQENISLQIEQFKQKTKMSYIDSFLDFCDERDLDPEELVNNIAKPLRLKLEAEFIERRMVKDKQPVPTLTDLFD